MDALSTGTVADALAIYTGAGTLKATEALKPAAVTDAATAYCGAGAL
jgi:hypothetical protein